MPTKIHPLAVLAIIVVLSLVVATVLFGVLDSTGFVESRYVKFGGAAAGFFASLYFLQRAYERMEKRYTDAENLASENRVLKQTLSRFDVPQFDVPPSFAPYIDHEHRMLYCYPDEWRRQPLQLQIQAAFSENPLNLHPGDDFPGSFTVAISSPGQKTVSLKEVVLMAQQVGMPLEKVTEELGVEISPKTESLQVTMESIFRLLGAQGKTRQQQIYDMNYQVIELLGGEVVRRDTELVDGVESLLVERRLEREHGTPLVQFMVVTYLNETDLIFTFVFTDNLSDRETIDGVRKRVLSTVKFWKASAREPGAA
jgi:hypothetical protein